MEEQNTNNKSNISEIISSNGNNKEAWVNLLCDINSDVSQKIHHDVISILKNNLKEKLNEEITLDILDFLVNYGEPSIIALIAKWDLINKMLFILRNECHSSVEVKKKIIFLSQKWGKKYENDKNFQIFVDNYKGLQKMGIIFPPLTYKLETYTKYISEEEAQTAQIKAKAMKNIKENNKKCNIESQNEDKMKNPLSSEIEKNENKESELKNENKIYDNKSIVINKESNHEENPYHDDNNRGNEENNRGNLNSKDEKVNENEENNISNGISLNKKDSNNDNIKDSNNGKNNEQIINIYNNDDKNSNNNNNLNNLISEINNITINEDKNNKNKNLFSEEQSEQSSRYPDFPSQFDKDTMSKLRSVKNKGKDNNDKPIKTNPGNLGNNINGSTPNGLDINNNTKLPNINKDIRKNPKMDETYKGMSEKYQTNITSGNKPFKYNTVNEKLLVKKHTLPTKSNPFEHNINYLGLKSKTFDVISFKRDLGNKLLQLNKWIDAGKFNFNSNQLKQGIKLIINEIPKCEHMMVQYQISNDRNGYAIVRNMKMDIEQTCSRYESLINDRIVEPFRSSFCGNSRQYYFNKCNLLGNQVNSYGMKNFEDYYKGSSGYGSSGSNYNYNNYNYGYGYGEMDFENYGDSGSSIGNTFSEFGNTVKDGLSFVGGKIKDTAVNGYNFVKGKVNDNNQYDDF